MHLGYPKWSQFEATLQDVCKMNHTHKPLNSDTSDIVYQSSSSPSITWSIHTHMHVIKPLSDRMRAIEQSLKETLSNPFLKSFLYHTIAFNHLILNLKKIVGS